jgi:hypothetical protein|tara:strand:+ start:628 stop:915 length:288 start_codon:yes stop_codon:yes gene_type:complete
MVQYSDAEIDNALMDELKKGLHLQRNTEHIREGIARKEAHEMKGKRHPLLGECVATIPAKEFFNLVKKYGHDHVHSKEFIRDYQRRFPHLSPNRL